MMMMTMIMMIMMIDGDDDDGDGDDGCFDLGPDSDDLHILRCLLTATM